MKTNNKHFENTFVKKHTQTWYDMCRSTYSFSPRLISDQAFAMLKRLAQFTWSSTSYWGLRIMYRLVIELSNLAQTFNTFMQCCALVKRLISYTFCIDCVALFALFHILLTAWSASAKSSHATLLQSKTQHFMCQWLVRVAVMHSRKQCSEAINKLYMHTVQITCLICVSSSRKPEFGLRHVLGLSETDSLAAE